MSGSKWRRDSSSSPKNSSRTGHGLVSGQTSRMPPRRAISPFCVTWASGSQPRSSSHSIRSSGLILSPRASVRVWLLQHFGRKGFLQKRGDTGDDDPGSRDLGLGSWRQGDQCLEPVADGVGMRESAFVRQHVPGWIKQRRGWSRLRVAKGWRMEDGFRRLWTVDCGLWTQDSTTSPDPAENFPAS